MSTGPIILLAGPILVAAAAFFLRRWPMLASLAGGIGMLFLSLAVAFTEPSVGQFNLPADEGFTVLGRSFFLTAQVRLMALIVLPTLAILFVCSAYIPQGMAFVAVAAGLASPLHAVVMIEIASFGAILLVLAACLMAILIQGQRPGSTLAALRYLSLVLIAAIFLLVAGWLADSQQFSYVPLATTFFALAFVILFASFPFHIWIPSMLAEASAFVPVVQGCAQFVVVVFCLRLIQEYPTVRASLFVSQLLRTSGLISVTLATFLILSAPSLGRLLGYGLVLDLGATAIALSFVGQDGIQTTLSLALLRIPGLLMAGIGLGILRLNRPDGAGGDVETSSDLLLRHGSWPGILLFAYGTLSLIGLPLTPGFAGRWAVGMLLARQSAWQASLLVLSVTLSSLVVIKLLIRHLNHDDRANHSDGQSRRLGALISWVFLVAGLVIALFPQVILSVAIDIAESL